MCRRRTTWAYLPDVLRGGCDAVDACSFGANEIVFDEFGLKERTRELNRTAAEVIGRVRDEYTRRRTRGSIRDNGAGNEAAVAGHTTWDELHSAKEQATGLIEGGIDVLKVETCRPAADEGVAGGNRRGV
jgi:5-methyltetrahydrofolate--homocysteine methyltransferase